VNIDKERNKLQKEYAITVSKLRIIESKLDHLYNKESSVKFAHSLGNRRVGTLTTRST